MHHFTAAPGSVQAPQALRILAIDLGKFTSVACDYDTTNHSHTFTTVKTRPDVLHDLIVQREPGIEKDKKGVGIKKGSGVVLSAFRSLSGG